MKDLARVFTHSSNPHRSLDSNRAFQAELEKALAQVAGYSEGPTLKVFLRVCEGLILKWQRAYFDSLSRGGKRVSVSGQVHVDEASKPKRARAEQGAYATSDDNHCEGCGIPRNRRDQCQLSDHPDWNSRGLWTESSAFSAIKKRQEASGSRISIRSSSGPNTPREVRSPTQGSPIRIVRTGQGIDRSKRTDLRPTRQRTGRASIE